MLWCKGGQDKFHQLEAAGASGLREELPRPGPPTPALKDAHCRHRMPPATPTWWDPSFEAASDAKLRLAFLPENPSGPFQILCFMGASAMQHKE